MTTLELKPGLLLAPPPAVDIRYSIRTTATPGYYLVSAWGEYAHDGPHVLGLEGVRRAVAVFRSLGFRRDRGVDR